MLAGGFAVMAAALAELRVAAHQSGRRRAAPRRPLRPARPHACIATAAWRPSSASSSATTSIARTRKRVAAIAKALYLRGAARPDANAAQRVEWAALLHEVGFTVSHIGFHKHGAYILENADMPGFSAQEQRDIALLVLGCRGGLDKVARRCSTTATCARKSSRCGSRCCSITRGAPIDMPRITLAVGATIRFHVPVSWLKAHPQTAHLIEKERAEWAAAGVPSRRCGNSAPARRRIRAAILRLRAPRKRRARSRSTARRARSSASGPRADRSRPARRRRAAAHLARRVRAGSRRSAPRSAHRRGCRRYRRREPVRRSSDGCRSARRTAHRGRARGPVGAPASRIATSNSGPAIAPGTTSIVSSGGAVVRSIEVRRADGGRVSIIATGDSADATPAHDQVVAATARLRSSTAGMLRTLAQKTADTPDSSAAPAYHASVNAIPRRGHGGSTASIRTTAKPSRCSRCATALPISSQPSTIATSARFGCTPHFPVLPQGELRAMIAGVAFPECDSPPGRRHRPATKSSWHCLAGVRRCRRLERGQRDAEFRCEIARSRRRGAVGRAYGRRTSRCCRRRRKIAVSAPPPLSRAVHLGYAPRDARLPGGGAAGIPPADRIGLPLPRRRHRRRLAAQAPLVLASVAQRRDPEAAAQGTQGHEGDLHSRAITTRPRATSSASRSATSRSGRSDPRHRGRAPVAGDARRSVRRRRPMREVARAAGRRRSTRSR